MHTPPSFSKEKDLCLIALKLCVIVENSLDGWKREKTNEKGPRCPM